MVRAVPSTLLVLASLLPAQGGDLLMLERGEDRAARDRLRARLARIVLGAVELQDASAKELAKYLMTASGNATNFVVATRTELPEVSLELRKVRLTKLMAVIRDTTDLRFVFTRGLVKIQHADEVREHAYLRLYDVRGAVAPIPSRPGPKLGLSRGQQDAFGFIEDEEPSSTASGFTIDRLVDTVRSHAVRDSWDREGRSISANNGVLWVRQTDRGHREVLRVLRLLGAVPVTRRIVVRPRRGLPRAAPRVPGKEPGRARRGEPGGPGTRKR